MKNYIFGNATSQILGALFFLWIAKLYSPVDVGKFSVFLSVSSIIGVASSCRYELGVFLSDSDLRNKYIYIVVMTLPIAVIVIIGALSILVTGIFNIQIDKNYIFYIGFASYFISINNSMQILLGKFNKFGHVNRVRFFQQLIFGVIAILNVKLGRGLEWLLICYIMISAIFCFYAAIYVLNEIYVDSFSFRFYELGETLISERKYALFQMPGLILNSISMQSPLLVFAYCYGYEISAFVALSLRVIRMPMSFVGGAIAEIFRKQASEDFLSGKNSKKLIRNIQKKSLYVMVPLSFFAMAVSYPAINHFLGNDWSFASFAINTLLPTSVLQLLVSPFVSIFFIKSKNSIELLLQVFILLASFFPVLLVANMGFDADVAIIAYAMSYSLIYIVFYRYLTKLI